jgi:hypothetical protein
MILRCPSCGREGKVPDRWGDTSHRLRCRPCGARFSTGPALGSHDLHATGPVGFGASGSQVLERLNVSAEEFFAGSEHEMPAFSASPYDSQYDMPAVVGDDPDDSQVELPAFTTEEEEAESGEVEAVQPFEADSSEFYVTVPWYYKFIESWGRVHFYVVVGFAASALALLGFLLTRELIAGQVLSSSLTALIVGLVGTVAFLLLSLSATVLIALLIDLARNLRLLILQNDRPPMPTVDVRNRNGTGLSQPVG